MKIGVIGPTENEIMPFIEEICNKKVENVAMLTFYRGIYKIVMLLHCIVGFVKLMQPLQLKY